VVRRNVAQTQSSAARLLMRVRFDNRSRLRELAAREPPPRVAIFRGAEETLILS
jgi:hypothetical protein